MKTTLLVMTLNEVDGLKAIMPRVDRSCVDQIIMVDGGSTDGSIAWAEQNGFQVYVQKQKGFRHAYTEVWPLVEGDVVVTFSPDGNSVPELIPDLIAKMRDGYDMVVASRYLGDADAIRSACGPIWGSLESALERAPRNHQQGSPPISH